MCRNLNTCDVFWTSTDEAECSRKVARGRRVADVISSLVSAGGLRRYFARVLHKSLLVPVLTYVSETIIWREKESLGLWVYR